MRSTLERARGREPAMFRGAGFLPLPPLAHEPEAERRQGQRRGSVAGFAPTHNRPRQDCASLPGKSLHWPCKALPHAGPPASRHPLFAHVPHSNGVGSSLVSRDSVQMNAQDRKSIILRSPPADAVSDVSETDATRPDDAPSPAELAFIERVRSDRARARRLLRRALIAGSVSLAAIAAVVLTHGLPPWLGGHDIGPAGAPEAAPGAQLSFTRDSRGPNPALHERAAYGPVPSDGEALEQRIARLEARLDALEHRATVERGPRPSPSVAPPAVQRNTVNTAKVAAPRRDTSVSPAVAPKRVAAVTAASRTVPPREAQEPTLGDRLRSGWETIERQVRRTPDHFREGANKVRRVFAD